MAWFQRLIFAGIVVTTWAVTVAHADELHGEIDRRIDAAAGGPLAGPASDAEFVRRAWLDFAGRIPTAAEARSFLDDKNPDKRTRLIDRLLASSEYPQRMQEAVSVMLLDRRDSKAISDEAWNGWLRTAFAANRPWNEIVRELLAADGTDEKTRPAIRFFIDGGRADAHLLTQDVARIFLGVNWQCAQCHNHPIVDDYKQAHYFGLYAFLNPSKVHTDKQSKAFLIEGVTRAKVEFVSVFVPDDKRATGPKLLDAGELAIPEFKPGEEFETPPDPKTGSPGVPKFRPRQTLAEQLTAPGNRPFARNAVNRFWFLLMGHGLVHPLDLHHSANPPSHPELLETLTDEFIAHRCDVKWLLREIALSAAWQRSSECPEGVAAADIRPERFRTALPRPLSAEQIARSLAVATGAQARLDATPGPAASKFTQKDYINGRLPPPDNWKDVFTLFASSFGHPAGQPEVDFRPSVEQSLFLTNDRLIAAWLATPGGLIDRLQPLDDISAAEEACLTFLARRPSEEERTDLLAFLKGSGDRRESIIDLCRVLLASAEFRLNH